MSKRTPCLTKPCPGAPPMPSLLRSKVEGWAVSNHFGNACCAVLLRAVPYQYMSCQAKTCRAMPVQNVPGQNEPWRASSKRARPKCARPKRAVLCASFNRARPKPAVPCQPQTCQAEVQQMHHPDPVVATTRAMASEYLSYLGIGIQFEAKDMYPICPMT